MRKRLVVSLILLLVAPITATPAGPETGPVIEGYGPVFAVPEDSFNLDSGQVYRVMMDIGQGPDDPSVVNRGIESAARFLNMHARNGIRPENLQLALVLHGSATRSALDDAAYRSRFDQDNANKPLIEALSSAGVKIYVCGQSAAYHGFAPADLLAEIGMAISAMTVHVKLQQEGYKPILFR